MAIQSSGRGRGTHLIKLTLGYEPGTGKRLYYTETFKGTIKDARLREAELKIQHRDKKLVLSSEMTFRECFAHHLDEGRSRLSPSTFHTRESVIKRHLLPTLGNKKLKELVREDFQTIYDSLNIRGWAPSTIHTLHGVAKAVINWATRKRLLHEDILERITLPKIPKAHPAYLTYEEMQAFFDVAPNYWYGNAFKFQFMTGLRNQELMALKWEDVNFETEEIVIRRACVWITKFEGFKSTKTGVERTLELDLKTINLLKRVKAAQEAHISARVIGGLSYGDEQLIFCTRDGRVPTKHVVNVCFKKILKKIGITRHFRWYDVRHTHGTHMHDAGGGHPKMIANRMGHSVETFFRIYGHEMKGQQRKALRKISSRVTL
jgi:integrase